MNYAKKLISAAMFTCIAFAATAQQGQPQMQMQQQPQQEKLEVSDEKLQQFVDLSIEIQEVQQSSEKEMLSAIEQENLDVQKFQMLAQSQQNPKAEVDATEEEMEAFSRAAEKVTEIQMGMQGEIQEKIQQNGFDQQEFQQISMAYQRDEDLQRRVNEMLPEEMKN